MLERINFYDGGVVTLAKNLSDQGKSISEIFEEINIRFPNLGTGVAGKGRAGGSQGKPTDISGVRNILKKELSPEVYNERHGPRRFAEETIDRYKTLRLIKSKPEIVNELGLSLAKQSSLDKELNLPKKPYLGRKLKYSEDVIEEFKRIRPFTSETDIQTKLGISKPFQTVLARSLGLKSKVGNVSRSQIFQEAESVGTAINNRIDVTKSVKENFDVIYPDVKNQTFRTGSNVFGKPSKLAVTKAINQTLMSANQLSVDEYKDEIKKMVNDRNYSPKGLDPLGIKTGKLTYYKVPNYEQAKRELKKEIPSLDKRLQTNLGRRKKETRKLREIEDPNLKLSRLSQKARKRQINRLKKLGLSSKLSPREEAINQTQTIISKSSNDRIKANPNAMIKYLKANPNTLKALGTRVNRQTGQIYYENPNLSFLNTDPKDTARYFEIDHGREISKQAGKLIDTPENRNTIPRLLNQGFKRDAEIFIESNPNPKDPNVRAVLEEAKKLNVRIRPNVEPGIFKTDDFFRPRPNPILKIQDSISLYAPPEFQTTEITLPKDRTGKIITQLLSPGGKKLLSRAGTKGAVPVVLAALGLSAFGGGSAEAAEVPQPEVKQPTVSEPLQYNKEIGAVVNTNTDQKADQNQILEYIKENPLKVTAGTSIGFAAQEVPGAYKAARDLGRGRVRSTLGISGALRPILTTFGTPLMTGLYEGAIGAKRLEDGETMTDVLTDPLGPALGISLMEPLSKLSGVVKDAPKRTMLEGARNYFNLSNVGQARPGITGQILRMGMSPRMIAGASRFLGLPGLALGLGMAGYDAYKNYQNQEGMIYNLFNRDE